MCKHIHDITFRHTLYADLNRDIPFNRALYNAASALKVREKCNMILSDVRGNFSARFSSGDRIDILIYDVAVARNVFAGNRTYQPDDCIYGNLINPLSPNHTYTAVKRLISNIAEGMIRTLPSR